MIAGFNHVGLSVADIDRSISFYRDLLGLELVVRRRFEGEQYSILLNLPEVAGTVALLRSGDLRIELFEFANPVPRAADPERPVCDQGITHFCLSVEDLDGEYRRLAAAGVRFHSQPVSFFDGAAKAVYVRDPDGNVFELIERFAKVSLA